MPFDALDLGCGDHKIAGSVGIDLLPLKNVDIVANFEYGLPFKNAVFSRIYASNILEHIGNLVRLMSEIHRIAKSKAIINISVPHFSNPLGYSDFTHKRTFGYFTFDYFSKQEDQTSLRKVPDFYVNFHFKIVRKHLVFYELYPRIIEAILTKIFNLNNLFATFYEKHLSWILPAREIRVELEKG